MEKNSLYKLISISLIAFSVLYFFLGFYLDENTAGAGGPNGDIFHIWNNLNIFINNDIVGSIIHPKYYDSRLPVAYLMHEFLNPFIDTKMEFRISVLIISLIVPILFFLCLKRKFKKSETLLLLLISSTVFLSPYFRTSAYWGLEENYGLIFLLLTFLVFNSFLKNENSTNFKLYLQVFFITFFSSCCFYFDQKLIIIPLICFFQIMLSQNIIKVKIITILFYFIFSIPFIYLIILWEGSIVHPRSAFRVVPGESLILFNLGYTATIIAFYLFPILFFLNENLLIKIKNFLLLKVNYYLLFLIIVYILYLMIFLNFGDLDNSDLSWKKHISGDLQLQPSLGKGVVHKFALLFFSEVYQREIFTYISFLFSGIILLIFLNKNLKNTLILLYFFILTLVLWPILQEYFDPLILLMAFTFFNLKMRINYKNVILLYGYLFLFLVGSNIYYSNLLN